MSFPLDAVAFWIAHPHLYAEAFNIAIMRAAQSHVRWVVQEPLLMLWHTYLPSGDAASQDVPANARRRRGHGFVASQSSLW